MTVTLVVGYVVVSVLAIMQCVNKIRLRNHEDTANRKTTWPTSVAALAGVVFGLATALIVGHGYLLGVVCPIAISAALAWFEPVYTRGTSAVTRVTAFSVVAFTIVLTIVTVVHLRNF